MKKDETVIDVENTKLAETEENEIPDEENIDFENIDELDPTEEELNELEEGDEM